MGPLRRHPTGTSRRCSPLFETLCEEPSLEGHEMQGDGCTQRNLVALVRTVMLHIRFEAIIDFLLRTLEISRQFRKHLDSGPFLWHHQCRMPHTHRPPARTTPLGETAHQQYETMLIMRRV